MCLLRNNTHYLVTLNMNIINNLTKETRTNISAHLCDELNRHWRIFVDHQNPSAKIFSVSGSEIEFERNSGVNYDKFLAYLILAFDANVFFYEKTTIHGDYMLLMQELVQTIPISHRDLEVVFNRIS